jgi:hypothetical protein
MDFSSRISKAAVLRHTPVPFTLHDDTVAGWIA